MSPALSPLVSALERAAELIESGAKPAAALRQVAQDLVDYENAHVGHQIPPRAFKLGDGARPGRVI